MKENLVEGILYAQEMIKGSITILLMTPDGILAARDRLGRLPVLVGKHPDGSLCVSFESFAYHKLGYEDAYELGPREIVALTRNGYETVSPPGKEMKICGFLWTYYGYPNSNYEGVNVEVMRYRNGEIMARDEVAQGRLPKVDYVAGVPDSGVPHAIGFANRSGKPFARPFVKYTPTWPRSFTPANQEVRNQVAKMKQIPVSELIQGKKLLFVDDSIVRGTQLRETVDFLYESGAEEVHMRSACPPIMYSCKYLNFSRGNSDMELLGWRVTRATSIWMSTPIPPRSGVSACSSPSVKNSVLILSVISLWTACWKPSASTGIRSVPTAGTERNDRHGKISLRRLCGSRCGHHCRLQGR